jgi:hypothetical protein
MLILVSSAVSEARKSQVEGSCLEASGKGLLAVGNSAESAGSLGHHRTEPNNPFFKLNTSRGIDILELGHQFKRRA